MDKGKIDFPLADATDMSHICIFSDHMIEWVGISIFLIILYMFTINIRDIAKIGKGEMKWNFNDSPAAIPTETPEQKSAQQALKYLKDYGDNDTNVLMRLLNKVHEANADLAKKNQAASWTIEKDLQDSIATETDPEKKRILTEIQAERTKKMNALDTQKAADSAIIKSNTVIATRAAVPLWAPTLSSSWAIAPGTSVSLTQIITPQADISTRDISVSELNDADPAKQLDNRIKVLCDFDAMSGVEKNNKLFGTGNQKFIIGEMQVYNILKDTLKTPADLTSLLSRFSITEDWNNKNGTAMRDAFRTQVIKKSDDIASISRIVMGDRGAGAGIVSVLQWTEKAYLTKLLSSATAQKKIETVVQKDSVLGMKIVSTLLAIGVWVMSAGKLHFSFETRDLDKGDPLALILGNSVNFTAKLRMFEAAVQLNVNDKETQYIKDTLKFSETLTSAIQTWKIIDTSKIATLSTQDLAIVKFYNENLSTLPPGSDKALIDELARNHLITLAKSSEGASFKWFEAGYSLISKSAYVGVVGQYMGSRVEVPRQNGSVLSDIANNTKEVSHQELGIIQEKTSDNQYRYTLPAGYTDKDGELAKMGFVLKEWVYTTITLAPLAFSKNRIYHVNGDIEDSITISPNATKITPVAPTRVQTSPAVAPTTRSIPQAPEKVAKLNDENQFKEFVNQILYFSRKEEWTPYFDRMLQAIGKDNLVLAQAELDNFAKKNPTFGKQIQKYVKSDASRFKHLTQLTYLSKGIQAKKEISKTEYNNARKGVIAAEDRLAPDSKNLRTEGVFKNTLKHTPKHISDIPDYTGQALSVSVYATPAWGTHRIDKYNGSIPVSSDIVPLDKNTELKQIDRIISDHATKIEQQRVKLNKELFDGKEAVTQADYTNMLKTGAIPSALTAQWLSFVPGKWPKFFEARAMIFGSICANKTEGIAYPMFGRTITIPGQPAQYKEQPLPPVETIQPPTFSSWGFIGEDIGNITEIGLGLTIPKKPDTPPQGNNNPNQQPATTSTTMTWPATQTMDSASWTVTNAATATGWWTLTLGNNAATAVRTTVAAATPAATVPAAAAAVPVGVAPPIRLR